MVTSYEDCSSQIVSEDEFIRKYRSIILTVLSFLELREAEKVDDACLLYVVREDEPEVRGINNPAFNYEPLDQ